jgi:glycosyltransferase involved in cell wall biosynthesis
MRGPWDLRAVARLSLVIRSAAIDVVHTHSSVDAWVAGLAARAAGVPVVRSRHVSIPIGRGVNPVYRWLADRVVTSGEAIRKIVLAARLDARQVVAIPAGVDLEEFSPGPADPYLRDELAGGAPVIGSVAMFRGSKGHDHLLDAFARVRASWPEARLLLVGDGVRRDWVERLVAERGLGDAVRLAGFRRDVAALLRLMDCFVLASTRTEGVPQSLLQALAVGVPVVASAIGGIPEVVTHLGNGLLVPPGEVVALADAIASVLRDPEAARKRSEAGRELVAARYSRDASIGRTIALYRELLA